MNTFADTMRNKENRVRTENAGVTLDSSVDALVDLFFTIGALRGQGTDRLYRLFAKAHGENPELAARVALWARDARQGAGERQIFRDILLWLELHDRELLDAMLPRVPDLGRWDDLLVFNSREFKQKAYKMIVHALAAENGLAAKWMPRKGKTANELRKFMGLTPRDYRKLLVRLTNVVEQQMCANHWEEINYSHVPSLAQSRYNKAFLRHDEQRYRAFMSRAAKGEEKVNAGAVYPYDVLKPVVNGMGNYDPNTVRAQWDSLPDYTNGHNALPIIDVSASMNNLCGGNLKAIDVSVSLGLYLATKNKGAFNNLFMTFSEHPEFVRLTGSNIVGQVQQIQRSSWGFNTNVYAALKKVAEFGRENDIPQDQMPQTLLIISDMEFDQAGNPNGYGWGRHSVDPTTYEAAVAVFNRYGYEVPNIVWWNVQSRQDNVPVRFDQKGTALVSGFSPAIAKNVMSGKNLTPRDIMLDTILVPRYNLG